MVRITLSLVTQSKRAAHCGLDTFAEGRAVRASTAERMMLCLRQDWPAAGTLR